jgi:hypothetical protein
MTGARGTVIKFTTFVVVMLILTGFLFLIFSQYRTGATNRYSAVFSDASPGVRTNRSGRRCPGRHRARRLAAAGQNGGGDVRRRP